jgi:hypothetical protein
MSAPQVRHSVCAITNTGGRLAMLASLAAGSPAAA